MATVMDMATTMADGRTVGTAEAVAGRTAVEAGDMAEAGVEPAWSRSSGAVQAAGRRGGVLEVVPQAVV